MLNWNDLKEEFELEAEECFDWMKKEFSKINSGRVNVNIFNDVKVEAYGEFLPLNQVANIQVIDARQLLIKPYDKNQIKDINKSLSALNLSCSIQLNVDHLRISFAALTEETRKQNVKKAKEVFETGKIKIRNVRQGIQSQYKKDKDIGEDDLRYFEDELNKTTKTLNAKLEEIFAKKEHELMTL